MRSLVLTLATMIVCLLLGEAGLRLAGFEPWDERRQHPFLTPSRIVFEPDPVLGWRNLPGRFEFIRGDGKAIVSTNLPDGSRYSGDGQGERIVFVGGSYTYGWEMDDDDAFPSLVQRRFPDRKVQNFGTGGYGAYQSLLTIERIQYPAVFVYGFGDFHQARDVAREDWIRAMSIQAVRAHTKLSMPYVSFDEAGLHRHSPEPYGDWPMKRYSALVTLAEHAFYRWRLSDRELYRQKPTMEVIREMKRIAGDNRLIVMMLATIAQPGNRERYIRYFEANGIDYVDCVLPREPRLLVMGRGHPNEIAHRTWANCIASTL